MAITRRRRKKSGPKGKRKDIHVAGQKRRKVTYQLVSFYTTGGRDVYTISAEGGVGKEKREKLERKWNGK